MDKHPMEDIIDAEIVSETVIEEKKTKKRKFHIEFWQILAGMIIVAILWLFTGNLRTYAWARMQVVVGNYEQATMLFEQLQDTYDADEWLLKTKYQWGLDVYGKKEYVEAISVFEEIIEYEDAITYYEDSCYQYGHHLFVNEQYEQANQYFGKIENVSLYGYPHFETIEDASDYIVENALKITEEIAVYIGEEPEFVEGNIVSALLHIAQSEQGEVLLDKENHLYVIRPQYYPGVRIVAAVNANDTSILSAEELQVYQKAMQIVETAKEKSTSDFELELYLYDWLCENVTYKTESKTEDAYPRTWTSLGVLLDGQGNCQGFSDAFYLLGSLAGFDVRFQYGSVEELHVWNAIAIDDMWYYVDATFDSENEKLSQYSYFHFGEGTTEHEVYEHAQIVRTAAVVPTSLDYYEVHNIAFSSVHEAASYCIRQAEKNDFDVIVRIDGDISIDAISNAMKQRMMEKGYFGKWKLMKEFVNQKSYFMIEYEQFTR